MKANEIFSDFYKEEEYPDIEEIVSRSFDEALEECVRELGLDLDYEDEDDEEPEIDFEREDRKAEKAYCRAHGIRF